MNLLTDDAYLPDIFILEFLSDEKIDLVLLKKNHNDFIQWQLEQFKNNVAIEQILLSRSLYVDWLIKFLWRFFKLSEDISADEEQSESIALIAVGGYGRRELHPLSDIDLLFLSTAIPSAPQAAKIAQLLQWLWDLKLDVGHSVRTLESCFEFAKQDLTFMTTLLESRLIIGNNSLFIAMQNRVFSNEFWSSKVFFDAKVLEQQTRHQQYHGTSYNLEPDIKNSPGGLRDLQTIQWMIIRHYHIYQINIEQVNHREISLGFLSQEEVYELKECQRFLWRIRFALHSVIRRYDNRLLFQHQLSIANLLGYHGEGNLPVEKMMHDYYRVVHNVTELNQMVLQLFAESIFSTNVKKEHILDDNFVIKDGLIDIRKQTLFSDNPVMIMDIFYRITTTPSITGIHSNTIRQLRVARRQTTQLLSELPKARMLFLNIIRHPDGIKKALVLMHQLGILSIYIPGWKSIVGMMQFDLFHAYTVDQHTIHVLREIDNFSTQLGLKEYPIASHVYQELAQKELLIVAALFHDIAKGQDGDHSEVGAEQAEAFCQLHKFSHQETKLVSWLVRNHLLMSMTAQNRDIQNPNIIKEFAERVKTKQNLHCLLCLTIADICATNKKLWNGWKQSLLRELYLATIQYFDLGIQEVTEQRSIARQNKQKALSLLLEKAIRESKIQAIWQHCHSDYFLRYTVEQIVLHTQYLVLHDLNQPLVRINPNNYYGGTEIFIYAPDRAYLFAIVSQALDAKNLNIHQALITTNKNLFAMDTFIVLDPNGKPVDQDRHIEIQYALEKALTQTEFKPRQNRRSQAKLKHFNVPTRVQCVSITKDKKTYVELVTLDRPGLLAQVGEVFAKLELSLHGAKIITIGEQIKDLFILSDKDNNALSDKQCLDLQNEIIRMIDGMV